jgi:hypothetical protein
LVHTVPPPNWPENRRRTVAYRSVLGTFTALENVVDVAVSQGLSVVGIFSALVLGPHSVEMVAREMKDSGLHPSLLLGIVGRSGWAARLVTNGSGTAVEDDRLITRGSLEVDRPPGQLC